MGVEMIATAHRLTADLGEAARLALAAGVDVELPRTVAFGAPLAAALGDGRVDEALLDAAVGAGAPDEVPARPLRATLRRRSRRRPTFEALGADESRVGADAGRARRSSCSRTTACCRCAPDSAAWRSSGRSPTAPATCSATTATSSTWRRSTRCATGVDALGVIGDGEVVEPGDELSGRRTILDALRAAVADAEVVHARGTRHLGRDGRGARGGGRASPATRTSRSSCSASDPA